MTPLTPNDFPLIAIGAAVYRRTASSPLFTAPDDALAADLAFRLNRDHGWQVQASPGGAAEYFVTDGRGAVRLDEMDRGELIKAVRILGQQARQALESALRPIPRYPVMTP